MKTAKSILALLTTVASVITAAGQAGPPPPEIVTQPVTQAVPIGTPAYLTVNATGTLPLRYQWYFIANGTTNKLAGRTSPVLSFGKMTAALAGGYYVVVTSPILVPNSTTSAVANLSIATSALTVNIDGEIGSTVPSGSLLFGAATNGAVLDIGHTYSIRAIPGPNSVLVGWGQSFGDVPTTTSITGTPLGRELVLNFTMESNLILTASFETNPIIATDEAGTYTGLFYQGKEYPCMIDSTGFIKNWIVKTNGNFSGSIRIGGMSYNVAGTLDLDGNDEVVVKRTAQGLPNLDFQVSLYYNCLGMEGGYFEGSVSNMVADGWVADLYAEQDVQSKRAMREYTMLIPPGCMAPDGSPGGYGFASITNNNTNTGMVTIAGKLADGTAFNESVPMDYYTDVPIYVELNNKQGLLVGWIELDESPEDFGAVTWFKPGGLSTPATYQKGFTNQVRVYGSCYTPENGDPAIDISEGMASIQDIPAFGTPFCFPISINNNDQIVKLYGGPTNAFSGSITYKNGLFTAKFRPTGLGSKSDVTCYGAVLQNASREVTEKLGIQVNTIAGDTLVLPGAGYFLGTTNTGSIVLEGGVPLP